MNERESLETEGLTSAAKPVEDVIIASELDDPESIELRCAICGVQESESIDLPVGYSNPVCAACDELAVNASGDEPWHGYPPGEEPEKMEEESESDSDGITIRDPPDQGENPVYIAGVKCWRLYRFGG